MELCLHTPPVIDTKAPCEVPVMRRISILSSNATGADESKKLQLDTPSIFYKRSSSDQHDKYTPNTLRLGRFGVAFKENDIQITTSTSSAASFHLPCRLLPSFTNIPSSQVLSQADILTCQNLEIFTATNDDFADFRNVTEGGLASDIGQIGLRCIHCGQSPFAKAELSVTFPGCLNSLSLCVQRMGGTHLPNCTAMPKSVKERFQSSKISSSEGNHLRSFCLDVCKEMGLCNREPIMSGIMLTKSPSIDTPRTPMPHPIILKSSLRDMNNGRRALQHMEQLQNQSKELLSIPSNPIEVHANQTDRKLISSNHNFVIPNVSTKWNHADLSSPSPLDLEDWPSPGSSKRFKPDVESLLKPGSPCPPCILWEDCTQMNAKEAGTKNDIAQLLQDSISLLDRNVKLHPSIEQLHENDRKKMGFFSYFVMKQFHPCTFTTEQLQTRRIGDRKSSELEYVGLQCVHCVTKQYLWLANTSFRSCLTRLSKHAMTCALSPKTIRGALQVLHDNPIEKRSQKRIVLMKLWDSLVLKIDEQSNMSILQGRPSNLLRAVSSEPKHRLLLSHPVSSSQRPIHSAVVENKNLNLLCPEDRDLLTPYVYRVMNFLERCTFTVDQDHRRKGETPIGFAGLRCTLCAKRCFYWTSHSRFTNSFSDVTKHVRTCSQIPSELKTELNSLYEIHHIEIRKIPRGAQAVFFRRLWNRLHGQNGDLKPNASDISVRKQGENQQHDEFPRAQSHCLDIDDGCFFNKKASEDDLIIQEYTL